MWGGKWGGCYMSGVVVIRGGLRDALVSFLEESGLVLGRVGGVIDGVDGRLVELYDVVAGGGSVSGRAYVGYCVVRDCVDVGRGLVELSGVAIGRLWGLVDVGEVYRVELGMGISGVVSSFVLLGDLMYRVDMGLMDLGFGGYRVLVDLQRCVNVGRVLLGEVLVVV